MADDAILDISAMPTGISTLLIGGNVSLSLNFDHFKHRWIVITLGMRLAAWRVGYCEPIILIGNDPKFLSAVNDAMSQDRVGVPCAKP